MRAQLPGDQPLNCIDCRPVCAGVPGRMPNFSPAPECAWPAGAFTAVERRSWRWSWPVSQPDVREPLAELKTGSIRARQAAVLER